MSQIAALAVMTWLGLVVLGAAAVAWERWACIALAILAAALIVPGLVMLWFKGVMG